MDREQAKAVLPIIQAFAEGKVIQLKNGVMGAWSDATIDDFNFTDPPGSYRVKPEPKLRPWKLLEIPIGAIARRKGDMFGARVAQVIVSADFMSADANDDAAYVVMEYEAKKNVTTQLLLEKWEWKFAHETNWKPCGVSE